MALTALDVPYETLPDWISQRQVVRGDGKAWLKDLRRVRQKLQAALDLLLSQGEGSPGRGVLQRHARVRRAVDACCLPTLADPTGRSTCAEQVLCGDAREIFSALLEGARKDEQEGTADDGTSSADGSRMTAGKTFLGYYSDPLLAAWDEVVRGFDKNNLFVAEGARALVQDCKYEVVALRAALDKSEKRVAEIDRRVEDLQRASRGAERELVDKCVTSGLLPPLTSASGEGGGERGDEGGGGDGDDYGSATTSGKRKENKKNRNKKKKRASDNRQNNETRRAADDPADPAIARARARQARALDFEGQLVARVGGLGSLLRAVHARCHDDTLRQACDYYLAFARFVHGQGDEALAGRLACLRRLAASELAAEEKDAAKSAAEVDFDATAMMTMHGDDSGSTDLDGLAADMGVDWGIEEGAAAAVTALNGVGGGNDGDAAKAGAVDIDWDGDRGSTGAEAEPLEIDWGAEFETTDGAQESTTATVVAPLMDRNERHALLTDLLELECFLVQRRAEVKEAGDVGQVGSLRQLLQQQRRSGGIDGGIDGGSDAEKADQAANLLTSSGGASDLSRWIDVVRGVIVALRDDSSLQQLLIISRGGMGLAAMVTGFEGLRRKYEKSVRGIDALTTERLRLAEEARRQRPLVEFYRKKIARTKSVVEAGLTKHFGGRQIHLVGDLNTV